MRLGSFSRVVGWGVVVATWAMICGCNSYRHPLSNPKDSKDDPRLIGVWKVLDEKGKLSGDFNGGKFEIVVIGKLTPADFSKLVRDALKQSATEGDCPAGAMAISGLGLNRKNELITEHAGPSLFFLTQIAGESYINILTAGNEKEILAENKALKESSETSTNELRPEVAEKPANELAPYQPRYTFAKYEFRGERIFIWVVNEHALEDAIKNKEHPGKMRGNHGILTATTEDLDRYLRRPGGKKLFAVDGPPDAILERIQLKPNQPKQQSAAG